MSRVAARAKDWFEPLTINRTNLATGLSTTAAMLVPLTLGYILGHTETGLAISLGSLIVALADPGGSYHVRARWMLAATLIGALVGVATGLAGQSVWTAAPVAFVVVTSCALLSAFGNAATKLGTALAFTVAVMTSLPISSAEISARFVSYVIGGLLAMLFTLFFWPFRPLAPAATAVSAYFDSVSRLLDELTALLRDDSADPRDWETHTYTARAAAINSFEQARDFVNAERAGRAGASPPAERMLELISVMNRLYRWELSVSEAAAILSQQAGFAPIRMALADYYEQTARTVAAFSATISARTTLHADRAALQADLEEHSGRCTALQRLADSAKADGATTATELAELAEEARRTHDLLERAAAALLGKLELEPQEELTAQPRHGVRVVWETLRANLSVHASIARYAARVGIAVAAGIIVYSALGLEHGFWVTFTIVAVMKPDFGGSRRFIIQRVSATVVGATAAAGIIYAIPDAPAMLALLWPIGLVGFTLISVNYRVGIIFFTMFIVILVDLGAPGDVEVAGIRVLNTVIGGVIALAASYLLWPTWQRTLVPGQLADAVEANRAYLAGVLAAQRSPVSIRRLGRKARIANSNAETAFQRLLSEPARWRGNTAPFYVLLTHNQRIVTASTALDMQLALPEAQLADLSALRAVVDTTLAALAQAIRAVQPAPSAGALDDAFHPLIQRGQGAAPADLALSELGRIVDAIDAMVAATQVPEQAASSPQPMPAPQPA